MSTYSHIENDNGSLWTDLPWLRRALVFLSLGPLLGVFELMAFAAALGWCRHAVAFAGRPLDSIVQEP